MPKPKLNKKAIATTEKIWGKRKKSTYEKKNEIANQYDISLPRMIVLKSRNVTRCQGCHKVIPIGSTYYKNVFYPLFTGISHLNAICLDRVHRLEVMGTPGIPA